MKKHILLFFIGFLSLLGKQTIAQDSTMLPSVALPTYKVGIFAPLFLDSAFRGNSYKYSKKNPPKFVMPGLDFVQGAKIALDSMPVVNGNVVATIFDSKSYSSPIPSLIRSGALDSFALIIGSVKDAEYTQLAAFAAGKKVPFISATYPNDGGVTNNPYLAIASPTLRAHCEAIFTYLLQTNSNSNIILVRKPGAQEDKVEQYIRSINKQDNADLLKIKTINISDGDFTKINYSLDSTRSNVIIGGSLNESFANGLALQSAALTKIYAISLVGMPNWDGFRLMNNKKELKDFPIFYTTPFYINGSEMNKRRVTAEYKRRVKGNPSDLVFRAYDIVFLYSRLLTRYPTDYMEHLNDFAYKVFADYNFKPVAASSGDGVEYFENKKLYILKSLNGVTSKVW